MFLKVEYKKKKPDIFSIKKTELLIGNSDLCHVKIDHPSISRKHLKIFKKNDQWFASDQGSTNGTYSQGEQLIPGKKISLPPGLKLRLSQYAFVGLIEEADEYIEMDEVDEEVKIELDVDAKTKTHIINMPQFQAQKAHAIARRKQSKKQKELMEKEEKKQALSTRLKFIFSFSLIIYVSYFLNDWYLQETKDLKEQNVAEIIQENYDNSIELSSPFKIASLLLREQLAEKLENPTCNDKKYKDYCSGLYLETYFAAYEYDLLKVVFLVDQKKLLIDLAKKIPAEIKDSLGEENYKKSLFLELLKRQNEKMNFPTGKDIYLVFVKENDEGKKLIDYVFAFSQIYSDNILSKYDSGILRQVDEAKAMLKKVDKYYSLY